VDLTVADAVAGAVAQNGADRAFVFPGGGSNLEVIAALERTGVQIVLVHSETAAVLMAAAYADLVGRPTLVLVGLGPGVTSAVNGLAHARLDQSAVVLISDRLGVLERTLTGHQVLDQMGLLRPVVKAQATLGPAGVEEAVRGAFATAGAPPRGPVHLELAADVATAPASLAEVPSVDEATPPPASNRSLTEIATAVSEARRPVVLVGDEASPDAAEELVAFVEQLTAPVLVTPKAKGAVPEDHPLWCGILTNAALEAPLLERADLLIAIGLDPVELLSRPWTAAAPVVALRDHDEPVGGYGPAQVAIGDVSDLVRELARLVGDSATDWSRADAAAVRAEMLRAVRVTVAGEMTALEVVEEVQSHVPADATVTVDAGAHMFAAIWGWRATRPRHFLISNGLATMGFAVPAAIAAALAGDGAPVIAITGDGGFLLHGAELETAVRVRARILVVVLNDSSLSLIRIKQEDRGHHRSAVDFGPVDLAAYARSLGAGGIVAEGRAELVDAVAQGLAASGPVVIDVQLSGSEYRRLQQVIRVTGAPSPESLCLR
jgi:acetolactate synthase-1/2/3 large subunit